MPFTKETAREWGRVGGMVRTSRHDPSDLARSGQRGLVARFIREVDPEGLLDPEERARRVQRLHRAHMRRLNLMRTQQRRARRARASTEG